jgi:hypothetical protein
VIPLSGFYCTSKPCSFLDDLIDFFEGVHEFLVIVAANLVSGYQVSVDVVQLRVPFPHVFAVGEKSSTKFYFRRSNILQMFKKICKILDKGEC